MCKGISSTLSSLHVKVIEGRIAAEPNPFHVEVAHCIPVAT